MPRLADPLPNWLLAAIPAPETLATLWAHNIDYLQADFIGPVRAQLDFSFVPLKIVQDK